MIEVYPLFSKPIMTLSIDVSSVDLSNIKWGKNYTNSISTSQNVLELEEFSTLKKECYNGLNEYFYNIMSSTPDTEIYITESWFNKTDKDQVHHRHWHPNSIVSAIVYIDTEIGQGGETMFITSSYNTIEYDIQQPNLYNSKSWSLPPIPGQMLLFPSDTEHLVETYRGETPRISLSFNTFVKGNISKQALTHLSI